MSSTNTPSSKAASKGSKKSKIVIIRLSPDILARFTADTKSSSTPSSSIKIEPSPSVHPPEAADKSSESNATPLPPDANDDTDANALAASKTDNKRKKPAGTSTGRKRAPPAIDPTVPPRERARPGPKKKPRLPDGTIDRTAEGKKSVVVGPAPVAAHKLGPKANTGAINAGLRALDRSGKPCRRWERKPLQLKSFTGTLWGMSSWNAPARDSSFAGDVKSDSGGSSDINANGVSALPSERSNIDVEMTNAMESSPAPPVAA